jgi:hypothetical protein
MFAFVRRHLRRHVRRNIHLQSRQARSRAANVLEMKEGPSGSAAVSSSRQIGRP